MLHAYKYFASPNQKSPITDFYNNDISKSIVIEAVYIKEETDNDNFNEKGLNKWVGKNNEVKFRKTWKKSDESADKETFDPDPKVEAYVDKGFGGLEQILTNATPNIIFIEAIPNVKELTDWLDKQIKSKLLAKIKKDHKNEYNEALLAIKKLQGKVEHDNYLGQMSISANEYFCATFPSLEMKIISTPYKDTDLSKAFEKDFSIAIGPRKIEEQEQEQEQEQDKLAQAVEQLEIIKDAFIEVETEGYSGYRQFDLHGHALIRQAIVTILGIFKNTEDGKKHIILFEEPELYLHPSNKRKFRDTLYKIASHDDYQVICVSHDPQLIDLSKEHTSLARFIQCADGQTEIHQTEEDLFIKDKETKDRIQMLNRFNPHICETFFSDEVILVEGDTEAIILRELLDKHYPNREVFVLNTGTKNNMPFFINVLGSFKIRQHIIHDSDERCIYEKGIAKINDDGTNSKNSAWTMNESIWNTMVKVRKHNGCFVRRYVSIRNFEHAHGYKHNSQKGKPLSAYEYAKNIDITDDSISIVEQLKCILGIIDNKIDYDQEYLDHNVIEPY